jgi:hypothetical protein
MSKDRQFHVMAYGAENQNADVLATTYMFGYQLISSHDSWIDAYNAKIKHETETKAELNKLYPHMNY